MTKEKQYKVATFFVSGCYAAEEVREYNNTLRFSGRTPTKEDIGDKFIAAFNYMARRIDGSTIDSFGSEIVDIFVEDPPLAIEGKKK